MDAFRSTHCFHRSNLKQIVRDQGGVRGVQGARAMLISSKPMNHIVSWHLLNQHAIGVMDSSYAQLKRRLARVIMLNKRLNHEGSHLSHANFMVVDPGGVRGALGACQLYLNALLGR